MNDMTNDFGRNPTVENIPLAELTPFRNHPFKVKDDAEMVQLTKSIADFGVLVPALARPTGNGYELISGHRRMTACNALGMETMPVIIRDMTDEEAIIAMVDSNLQREHILPSEKAFAYKMKYDAMKHQGTSRQLGTKLRTDEIIAEKSDDSARQIQRYIRLTNLIPDLLTMMDEGKIAFSVGV
jgi:ParB family chromosome partitioning protein